MLPAIFSSSGPELTPQEKAFFKKVDPLGFIIMRQNGVNLAQLKQLCVDFRQAVGRPDAPVLIDQEGGPVQRLRAPDWANLPNARSLGQLYEEDKIAGTKAIQFQAQAIAGMLQEIGITSACAPVLDISIKDGHEIIGERSYSSNPIIVGEIGTIISREFLKCGITPILKHIPGHGRANADSHVNLPVVMNSSEALQQSDFVPFKMVNENIGSAALWTMSAHVVYTAFNDLPFSIFKQANDIIRPMTGAFGPMISDTVEMEALHQCGDLAHRALACINGGCDAILYCDGKMHILEKIAEILPPMSDLAAQRFSQAEQARLKGWLHPDWRVVSAELCETVLPQHEALNASQRRVFNA